jgi:ABC-type molybdate transport system ATPase subunit
MAFMTNKKAFLVFLNNLYYSLDCNDQAFYDVLTNAKSKVMFKKQDSKIGYVLTDARKIQYMIGQFQKSLSFNECNSMFQDFINKNKIIYKAS